MANPTTDDGGRAKRVSETTAAKVKDVSVAAAGDVAKAAGATVNVVEKAATDTAKGVAGVWHKLTGRK